MLFSPKTLTYFLNQLYQSHYDKSLYWLKYLAIEYNDMSNGQREEDLLLLFFVNLALIKDEVTF